uniref:Uncharacterized protein n=1 Tax=Arundo donax TaxID=35708 RepID=A0A0A9AK97_ARUDO
MFLRCEQLQAQMVYGAFKDLANKSARDIQEDI